MSNKNLVMVLICNAKNAAIHYVEPQIKSLPCEEYDSKHLSVANHAMKIASNVIGYRPRNIILVSPKTGKDDVWLFKAVVDDFGSAEISARYGVISLEKFSEILINKPRTFDSHSESALLNYFSFLENTAFKKGVAVCKMQPKDTPSLTSFVKGGSYDYELIKDRGVDKIKIYLTPMQSTICSQILFNRYFKNK